MWSLVVVPLLVWIGTVAYLIKIDLKLSSLEASSQEADL
jgi:hypothetical protein